MNADKIVRALETEVLCENCPHNESNCPDDGCYYIMAAALIDKLQALAENGQSAIDTNMRLVKVVESLQAQLAEREKENERLREAQRWIPVEEKLPDFNDKSYHPIAHNCFVRDMHNNYASAIFYQPVTDKCDPWITSDEDIDTILITHWMPSPEPPKGE